MSDIRFGAGLSRAQALDLMATRTHGEGNGLVARVGEQLVGRSLIPGIGLEIKSPMGRDGDPEFQPWRGTVLLAEAIGLNLNTTADQQILIREVPRYMVEFIEVSNASIAASAAAGGFYTARGKAGFTLIAASQTYAGLTAADLALMLPCALSPQRWLTGPALYLSLTGVQGVVCTADVRVWGKWSY